MRYEIRRSKDGLRRVKINETLVFFESRKQAKSGYRFHPAFRWRYENKHQADRNAMAYLETGKIDMRIDNEKKPDCTQKPSLLRRIASFIKVKTLP